MDFEAFLIIIFEYLVQMAPGQADAAHFLCQQRAVIIGAVHDLFRFSGDVQSWCEDKEVRAAPLAGVEAGVHGFFGGMEINDILAERRPGGTGRAAEYARTLHAIEEFSIVVLVAGYQGLPHLIFCHSEDSVLSAFSCFDYTILVNGFLPKVKDVIR